MIGSKYLLTFLIPMILSLAARQCLAESGEIFLQLNTGGHLAAINSAQFTSNGDLLITSGDDKTVRIWDWRERRTIRVIRSQIGKHHEGKIFASALSPNDRWLALGGWMNTKAGLAESTPCCGDIRVFDFATGELTATLRGHSNTVNSLAFSSDSALLVSGSADGKAIIWSMASREAVRVLSRHDSGVSAVSFLKRDTHVATATYDGELRVSLVSDGSVKARSRDHKSAIYAVALSPSNDVLASAGKGGEIKLWRSPNLEHLGSMRQASDVGALAFSPNGAQLVSTSVAGYGKQPWQYVWNVAERSFKRAYKQHDNTVRTAAVHPSGEYIATAGGTEHDVHIWSLASGDIVHKMGGVGSSVWTVGYRAHDNTLVWGNVDPCPEMSACPNLVGELQWQWRLPSDSNGLTPIAPFDGDLSRIRYSETSSGAWSLQNRTKALNGRVDETLALVRNGVAVWSNSRTAKDGLRHSAYTFVPGNEFVVSAGAHGLVELFYRDNDRLLPYGEFTGHQNQVWSVATTTTGDLLFSASADKTIRIWNVELQALIATIFHDGDRDWVVWSPEGYYSSSRRGDQYVGWHVNEGVGRKSRYITARQLRQYLHSRDIVRRSIILKSSEAAVHEARGTDGTLRRRIRSQPPEFKISSNNNHHHQVQETGSRGTILTVDNSLFTRQKFISIDIDFAPNSQEIRSVEIVVNDRNVTPASAQEPFTLGNSRITRTYQVPLSTGHNNIRIAATNEYGVVSEKRIVVRKDNPGLLNGRGRLLVVSVGVDRYPFLEGRNLKFASADASAFFALVKNDAKLRGIPFEGELFVSSGGNEPVGDAVVSAFEDIVSKAKPTDTVMLFLAGHGENIDSQYFFLPQDAVTAPNGELRRRSLIGWVEFQRALERSQGRRVLFLDTCRSGSAFNPALSKEVPDARIIFFAATDAPGVSLELAEIGHGVFTHSILESVRSGGDANRDGLITFFELAEYVDVSIRRQVRRIPSFREQVPKFYLGFDTSITFAHSR